MQENKTHNASLRARTTADDLPSACCLICKRNPAPSSRRPCRRFSRGRLWRVLQSKKTVLAPLYAGARRSAAARGFAAARCAGRWHSDFSYSRHFPPHIVESPSPNPSLTLHHLQRCAVTRERWRRRRKFCYNHLRRRKFCYNHLRRRDRIWRGQLRPRMKMAPNPPVGAIFSLV
jgi:hypothetical protein